MINLDAKSPLYVSITGGIPFLFGNLDGEFEDGLWKAWPSMPRLMWWVMQRTFIAWNSVRICIADYLISVINVLELKHSNSLEDGRLSHRNDGGLQAAMNMGD